MKIWGIGNEMYGPWQWGHMDVTQYPQKHNLFVKAMRKVDPAMKVIASSATPEELSWTYVENRQLGTFPERAAETDKVPFAFGTKHDWTGALLAQSADYIDYLGEHFYGYPNLVIDAEEQAFVEADDPLTSRVRRMSNKVQMKLRGLGRVSETDARAEGQEHCVHLDEWAPRNRFVSPAAAPPAPVNPMLNPMTNALVYHEFFRHSGMVALGVATGGMGMIATDPYGDPVGFRMDGLVMKLLHDHFAGASPLTVNGNSPQRQIKGTVAVDTSERPSGSPTYPLDVVAALSADGKKLAISIVNPSESRRSDLNLRGVQPAGGGKLQQLTPAGAPAIPATAGRGFSVGPPATMAESSLPAGSTHGHVAALSISVYELEIR